MARRVPGYVKGTGAREVNKARASMRKEPRAKVGPAYSTDRSDARYKFEIHINHGIYDSKLSEVRREIDGFVRTVNRAFMFGGNRPKFSNTDLISTDLVKREGKEMGDYVTKINALMKSDLLVKSMYDNLAPDIGKIGVSEVRNGIKNPANRPRSFRYESGDMYNAVTYRKHMTKQSTVISIGWVDKFYMYFDYQERGRSYKSKNGKEYGIGAMDAIKHGYRTTSPKSFELMSRFLNNYTKSGGFSGRYTR